MEREELINAKDELGVSMEAVELIKKELGDFEVETYDHYGLKIISSENGEYAIGNDEEADAAAAMYIKDTVWAFNRSFIIEHSSALDYDQGSEDIIACIQEKCENGNAAALRLIDDIDEFVEDAISADGRGHFLSGYDGDELEIGNLLAYRIN
jgi:hypothetical protein